MATIEGMTPEEVASIRAKMLDPRFYIEKFLKIKTKKGGLEPFILNKAQLHFFNLINANSRVIINKSRQIGFSTAATAWLYHRTIMSPGINSVIIGYNADLTMELLDKVKTFWRSTPEEIRPAINYNSKTEISFPATESKIIVLPSSETAGRGYTIHNCLSTEVAYWDKAEEKMQSLEASVPLTGKLIVESTPSEIGTWYHRTMVTEGNGYAKGEYGWWWLYTQEEIDLIRKRMNDDRRFAVEYCMEFNATGRTVFDDVTLKRQRKNLLKVGDAYPGDEDKDFRVYEDPDGVRVYRDPVPGHKYVMGIDTAEGIGSGGDYTVVMVMDRETGEEVAFWRGQRPAERVGEMADRLGRRYQNALIVPEVQSHGITVALTLRNRCYPNLYYRQKDHDKTATAFTDRLGWKTSVVTKPLMIDDLGAALRDDSVRFRSRELHDEFMVFVYNERGQMSAQPGFHDDCVIAAALCLQGFKVVWTGDLEQIDYSRYLPATGGY